MPVWFNGEPLKRAMAEAHLAIQASAIGAVHLAGTRDGRYTHDTWVFLQGFCVLRPAWSTREDVNVVHLDSRQFMARLPDRDRLIDEDVQRQRIDTELKPAGVARWRSPRPNCRRATSSTPTTASCAAGGTSTC